MFITLYIVFAEKMFSLSLSMRSNPMLISMFSLFGPEGHWEPCNKVGSLSPAEHLVGFEPRTFYSNHNNLTQLATLPRVYPRVNPKLTYWLRKTFTSAYC